MGKTKRRNWRNQHIKSNGTRELNKLCELDKYAMQTGRELETTAMQRRSERINQEELCKGANRFIWIVGVYEKIDQCAAVVLFIWFGILSTLVKGLPRLYGVGVSMTQTIRSTKLFRRRITLSDKRIKWQNLGYYFLSGTTLVTIYAAINSQMERHKKVIPMNYAVIGTCFLIFLASILQLHRFSRSMEQHPRLQIIPILLMFFLGLWFTLKSEDPLHTFIVFMITNCCLLILVLCKTCLEKKIHISILIILYCLSFIGLSFSIYTFLGLLGLILLYSPLYTHNIQLTIALLLGAFSFFPLFVEEDGNLLSNISHGIVFTQSVAYIVACLLVSFIYPIYRFKLAWNLNLNYKGGYKAVDSYYKSAYNKVVQDSVAAKGLSLCQFGISSLKSDSKKDKLNGLRVMHAIISLKDEELITEISLSQTTKTLFHLLGCTNQLDIYVSLRTLAARTIEHLDACAFQIAGLDFCTTMVSQLLVKPELAVDIETLKPEAKIEVRKLAFRGKSRIETKQPAPEMFFQREIEATRGFFQYMIYGEEDLHETMDVESLSVIGKRILQRIARLRSPSPGNHYVPQAAYAYGGCEGRLTNYDRANNCFLNVIIQSLWHLTEFRKALLQISCVSCEPDKGCITHELRMVFVKLKEAGIGEAVSASALRTVLSTLYAKGSNFQEGQRNDAAEVLEVLVTALHAHEIGSEIANDFFTMTIYNKMKCECGGVSYKYLERTQFQLHIPSFELRNAKKMFPKYDFSQLLNHIINKETVMEEACRQCGVLNRLIRTVSGSHVVVIVIGWQQESLHDASTYSTLDCISTQIGSTHSLASMVCYVREHYVCFALKHGRWVMHSDHILEVIGTWDDVVLKCRAYGMEAQVLFFQASNGIFKSE